MIDERTDRLIEDAIRAELKACKERHGKFHNHHEAWAVLKEEVEEVQECFMPFCSAIESNMNMLWDFLRADSIDEESMLQISNIEDVAVEIVKEGIQVVAMCWKWIELIKKENA